MELNSKYIKLKSEVGSNHYALQDEYTQSKEKPLIEIDDFVLELSKDDIKNDYSVKLPSEYYELLEFCGSSFCWNFRSEEGDFLYGGYNTNGLWESLTLDSDFWKLDFSLGSSDTVPEDLKHFEKLNWFEKQAWGDDERFGCFIREKGVFPPKMAFFDRNWYVELTLSLDEYIDAMFASCAVKGWQYFYIDWNQEIPHKENALRDMELAIKYLPELFPARDFTYHKNKLKEVKQIL